MNTLTLIAITWIGKEYRFLGLDWSYIMVLGFIGNALFSMRFLVQWLASERQGQSIIPVSFWYWSIAGSALMCLYFVFRRDTVGLLALHFLFFHLTHNRRDRLKFLAVAEVHEFHTHCVAAGLANLFDACAHHLAFVRDQHNLVCFANCKRANDVAGFFAGSHRDDALTAARLPPVIIKRRAFANSIFTGAQQHGVWID